MQLEKMSEERLNMKFSNPLKFPFKFLDFSNAKNLIIMKFIDNYSFIILGSCPLWILNYCIMKKKFIIIYTERLFRNGLIKSLNPVFLYTTIFPLLKLRDYPKKLLLSVGKYTYFDFKFLGIFNNNFLKWGYYPKFYKYNYKKLLIKNSNLIVKILWVGRFISWKHPEKAILLARFLKKANIQFSMKIIGEGPLETRIKKLIMKYSLCDQCRVYKFKKKQLVINEMLKSNIFLMTSDQNEGWGVVTNEAMNSGCIVIGNKYVGSISFLINNTTNGFTYNGTDEDLFLKTLYVIQNISKLNTFIPVNAYKTIKNEWNSKSASRKLYKVLKNKFNF
jgi:glycosyltransferase involved in cell wall biosynthesis